MVVLLKIKCCVVLLNFPSHGGMLKSGAKVRKKIVKINNVFSEIMLNFEP